MLNQTVSGNVYFEDFIHESRDLKRLLEKRIESWVQTKIRSRLPPRTRYTLEVSREGYRRHLFVCRVEIQLGKRLWRGAGEGSDVTRALTQTLLRMTTLPEQRMMFPQNRIGFAAA